MKSCYVFAALVWMATCLGCSKSYMNEEQPPVVEQSSIYEMLRATGATVSLDDQGQIVAVDLDGGQSDEVLEMVLDIPSVKSIGLSGSTVTDAGVEKLMALSELKFLGLEDTNIKRGTVAKLREALPDCVISYGEGDE